MLGTLIGIFVGIMPSIGGSFILLAGFPFLLSLTPLQVIIFYVTFRISSQFSGSVSALLFGMLGEITSYPALKERASIIRQGDIYASIFGTAIGSTVATVLALLLTYPLLFHIDWTLYLLRSEMVFFVLVMIILTSCFWPDNALHHNLGLIAVGLILGTIGFNPVTGQEFLTFGDVYLSSGIPLLPVLIGFVAVPVAYKLLHDCALISFDMARLPSRPQQSLSNIAWHAVAKGSIVGWIAGLIPVLGSAMSSNMAWRVETWLQRKKGIDDAVARLVCAESANNSAVISVLIPLLLFGIAIIPSEMIVYHILEAQGWSHDRFSALDYVLVTSAATLSVMVAYLLCSPWISHMCGFFSRYHQEMTYAVLAITLVSVLIMAYREYSLVYYVVLLVLFSFLGILFRDKDSTPLILSFLAAEQLINSGRIIWQLYF